MATDFYSIGLLKLLKMKTHLDSTVVTHNAVHCGEMESTAFSSNQKILKTRSSTRLPKQGFHLRHLYFP